jgi:hypothetical protein
VSAVRRREREHREEGEKSERPRTSSFVFTLHPRALPELAAIPRHPTTATARVLGAPSPVGGDSITVPVVVVAVVPVGAPVRGRT